jgi:4'-phosphopantetheinyl transferase
MALLLYATDFPRQLPDAAFYHGLDRLPGNLQPKILRYRRWEDAHAALLGKLLLLLALKDIGSTATLDQLLYTPHDKPYFPSGPNFNISHSGNRVICALSTTGRVGIDIERIHPLSFDDFQTQFTANEWQAIHGAPDPVAAFYRFWTAKESLIKADGRGLGIPLLELDVAEYRPISLDGAVWTFQSLTQFPGYAAHLCTEETSPGIRFREFHPSMVAAGF